MKNKNFHKAALLLLIIYVFSVLLLPVRSFADEALPVSAYTDGNIKIASRFLELIVGEEKERPCLIPGGEVFGIRINEPYLTVSSTSDTSPLKRGDRIISINKKEVFEVSEFKSILAESGKKPIGIEIMRGSARMTVTLTPKYEDGEYKLGITLRDSAAGIGTVTFIDPSDGSFGGLGHGVSSESGELSTIESGRVCAVVLGSLKKGEIGKPGELSGVLSEKDYGRLTVNNECGVFGKLESYDVSSREAIPIGFREELREGSAEIISTLKNGKSAKYTVEISEIDRSANGSKCFKIKVTDPALIAISGGIVRGMSGSPIIQDGKLIGAVTHVLVANPTEGYGIFIENMLGASQMTRNELPAA